MFTKSNIPTPLPSTCSTPVDWKDLDEHLVLFGKEVCTVAGNGYCFLEAAREGIKSLTGKIYQVDELITIIMNEMKN